MSRGSTMYKGTIETDEVRCRCLGDDALEFLAMHGLHVTIHSRVYADGKGTMTYTVVEELDAPVTWPVYLQQLQGSTTDRFRFTYTEEQAN